MSDQFVTKFKFFWDDADHALESWLQDMARQGLHLHKVSVLRCWFVFRRGAPAEMSYRLDFQARRTKADYYQLFADAGWEHVDQVLGWHFWRVPVRAGRVPEIFTDVESRIRKYQRLIWLFALAWLPFFVMLPFRHPGEATPRSIGMLLGIAVVTLYAVLRLVLRIRRLRNPTP
jgi:Protein of unknown function (DUF2812)